VPFSDIIKAELADHLERLDPDDDQALVFTSPMGTPLRHSNFYRRAWLPAVARAGLPGIHFHDLRHAGNTLNADAGASLRELMDRMGHSSTRAALIYQHSSDERQRKLRIRARGLSQLLTASTRRQPLPLVIPHRARRAHPRRCQVRSGRDWCPYTLPGGSQYAEPVIGGSQRAARL